MDAGSEVDSPLFLAALQNARHQIAVLKEKRSIFSEFDRKMKQVITPAFGIQTSDLQYVLNCFDGDITEGNELLSKIQGTAIGTIPKSNLGDYAEEEHNPLSMYDPGVRESIISICHVLTKKENIPFHEKEEKRKSFLSRFALFEKIRPGHRGLQQDHRAQTGRRRKLLQSRARLHP